jgi:hypothetical protein
LLTFLAFIPLFALALIIACTIVTSGIIFIDIVFKAKPWYWQTLAFLLGEFVMMLEFIFLCVLPVWLLGLEADKYVKRLKVKSPLWIPTLQALLTLIQFGYCIFSSFYMNI